MATIFRPPIIVTITPRRKAPESWEVNLRVLYAPNPAAPFSQLDWPSATRAKAKAIGEAIGGLSPLYTPNPTQPFRQSDWINPVRLRPTQESDAPEYFIPPQPFAEASWPLAKPGRPGAKVDFVVNLVPLQNFVQVVLPFNQSDWPQAPAKRNPAQVDTVELMLALFDRSLPFAGSTESRIRAWPKAQVDFVERSAPIYIPNPDRPFINPIMMNLNAPRRPGAIVDAVANLLPPQNPPPPPTDSDINNLRFLVDVGSLMSR